MTWLLVAQLITASPQTIVWNGPRLAPAEAARILLASPGLSNAANWPPPLPDGPKVFVLWSSPNDGPYGPIGRPQIYYPVNRHYARPYGASLPIREGAWRRR